MAQISYTRPLLYPKQSDAFFHSKRYGLCEASTKAGKTVAAIAWIIEEALKGQLNQNFWWVAPVSEQSKIAFTRIKNGLPKGSFIPYESPVPKINLQGRFIWFKSGDNPECYDNQTEVLTNHGWKLFQDLDKTEQVLTLNPATRVAEWKTPTRYINQDYVGEMYKINSGRLDLLVTPNHRFFIRTRNSGQRRSRPIVANLKYKLSAKRQAAREILLKRLEEDQQDTRWIFKSISNINLQHDKIPATSNWIGTDIPELTLDRCAFLGIFLSEGCVAGAFGGTSALRKGNYEVHISQSYGEKGGDKGNVRRKIVMLLDRLGYHYNSSDQGFVIRNKSLWEELKVLGNCYTKRIPDCYKNLPAPKLQILLHWLLLGDGTIRGSERVYYSASKGLIDDIQELAIKAGFSAIIKEKKQIETKLAGGTVITPTVKFWQVSILNSKFNYFADSNEVYVSKEIYAGKIFCLTTENQTLYVRRNGKPCWSGNSLYGEDVYAAVVDEASRTKEAAWYALRSTLTATQGPVRMIGNVTDRKNWFYHLCRLAESGELPNSAYSKITILDAIAAGVLPASELAEARATIRNERVFRALFFAEPGDDGGNPFGIDHIFACGRQSLSNLPAAAYGIDLAKKQDYLVVIGLDKNGDVCHFSRWQGVPWRESIRRIWEIVGEDTPALVDSTGVGDPVLEELQAGHGNFQGYTFTGLSKQRLMEGLSVSIQGHEIGYPRETEIQTELEAFQYILRPTGVRYAAPEGYNDDCVCALALAREIWSTRAPGQNLIDFFSIQVDEAQKKQEEAKQQELKTILPFQTPSREEVITGELTELYEEIIKKSLRHEALCKACGSPIIGTKVNDGLNNWHPACYQ